MLPQKLEEQREWKTTTQTENYFAEDKVAKDETSNIENIPEKEFSEEHFESNLNYLRNSTKLEFRQTP